MPGLSPGLRSRGLAPPRHRRQGVRHALLHTLAGRAILVGLAARTIVYGIGLVLGPLPAFVGVIDTVAGIALAAGAASFVVRLLIVAQRHLLWRVRDKLILSYIFIGFTPVLLIATFFLLCGFLLFYNFSSYMVQSRLKALGDEARFLARSTVQEIQGRGERDVPDIVGRRQAGAAGEFAGVSFAVVPMDRACADTTAPQAAVAAGAAPTIAGPWSHVEPPRSVPRWIDCSGFAGLLAYSTRTAGTTGEGDHTHILVRAVAFPNSSRPAYAVIVDLPVTNQATQRLRRETGVEVKDVAAMLLSPGATPIPGLVPSAATPAETGSGGLLSNLRSLLEYRDWVSGDSGTLIVSMQLSVSEIYDRISAQGLVGQNTGQNLLLALSIIIGLFLVIEFVALVAGLALAKSITGSVHELFRGTERVRQADFTHKIAIHTDDQLGELAGSFNSMTASIEDLLRQAAEKKRLEEELRIAREIQMSLLPQGPLEMPGLSVTAMCVPAREVGGDYYDFFRLGERRLGVLIADVSGKGTSAAFYMAELKGLMLSLSEIHTSPRALLLAANRIIAANLDSRSFITMTYAVVDLDARTMTYARAGHTPLMFVPGPESRGDRSVRVLAPDGLVLGLNLDNGEMFERLLEEETIHLRRGDLAVFFTDGITEAMNEADDFFGEGRLGRLAEEHADLSSGRVARARPARDRGVCRHRAAARRHDDDSAQDRPAWTTLDVEEADHRRPMASRRRRGDAWQTFNVVARLVVIFRAHSDIEASVVRGLLEAHGVPSATASDVPHSVFPLTVSALGEVRISVNADDADAARRIIESHRIDLPGGQLVRLRDEFHELQAAIGYRFRDVGLLEHAMTHTSRANEDVSGGVVDNESLEFLGDAVLGFVIADHLFREFPAFDEGQKSKTKAVLVSTSALARQAERLSLGDHLLLGRGEEKTGGRRKAGAARGRLRSADRGDLPRRRHRAGPRVHHARVRAAHRRHSPARPVGPRPQVVAPGIPAVTRPAAARVPARGHGGPGPSQAVSRGRGGARRADRVSGGAEQEGSRAGSGSAGSRKTETRNATR